MATTPKASIRYNEEYFGYIAGLPDSQILLLDANARALLEAGGPIPDLYQHQLKEFTVRPNFYLNTPPLVWLELTLRCNLTCPHCYIDAGHARPNELTAEEFIALIDELADMGVWAVAITGGEPTMHPHFKEIVIHARQRGLLVGIATNGMFLTENLLDTIPRDGVIISVSLDDLHISGRDPAKDFRVASRAILLSQKMGFMTNIMTNTHRGNIDRLDALMSWAEEHDVSVRSVPFSPLGRGKSHPELENVPADVEKAAKFWLRECKWEHEYHSKVGLCVGSIFNYGLTMAYMTRRCSSGRFLAYICADGTVYPCTMCAGEKMLSPGNIKESGFASLWRSDWQIRHYNWDNFSQTCNGCIINTPDYYCASRCPAMSHARNGELFGCGASDFEIASTVVRTALLQRESDRIPLIPSGQVLLTPKHSNDRGSENAPPLI